MARLVECRDRVSGFYDPETGLRIKRGGKAELKEPLGVLTKKWLNAGGLVICEADLEEPLPSSDDPLPDNPQELAVDGPEQVPEASVTAYKKRGRPRKG